jgi:hypothetical protein
MRAWLRPVLDRFFVGLVPLDGDFGGREPAAGRTKPCPETQPLPRRPGQRSDEAPWIPSTILYGPPL